MPQILPIKIKYRLSLSEFLQACEVHWATKKQGSRTNLILGIIAVVFGVAMWSVDFWGKASVAIGLLLIAMVVVRSLLWSRAYRRMRKFASDIEIEFFDERIHVESADGKSDLMWSTYCRFLDADQFVLLYLSNSQFSVIPKSSFKNDEETQLFLTLLKTKLIPTP